MICLSILINNQIIMTTNINQNNKNWIYDENLINKEVNELISDALITNKSSLDLYLAFWFEEEVNKRVKEYFKQRFENELKEYEKYKNEENYTWTFSDWIVITFSGLKE